jgi:predicted Zn-dependent protease
MIGHSRGLWAAGLAITLALLQSVQPVAADTILGPLISEEDEARIGAEQHGQILAEFGGAYEDPELAAYVDSIGQFLALTSERPNVKFTFTVLNSPIVNAFALPGGYVYVSRGLLALADDEAELAGVVAHEIGHVAARHGAERMSDAMLANIGAGILGAIFGSQEVAGIAQMGALAIIQGYSKEQEHEADALGVKYLSRAGFDPEAMASFLGKLRAHSQLEAIVAGQPVDGEGVDFLSTHPRTADRVRRTIDAANMRPVANPIIGREIYLKKIDGILYGDDPEQGLVQGRVFLHPAMRFRFEVPKNFHIINGQTQVVAQGPEGAALVFDMDARQDRPSMSDYIRGTWAPEARLSGLEAIRVNGFAAATAIAEATINQRPTQIRLVAIEWDSRIIFRFMYVMPAQASSAYDEAYRRTTYSFRSISRAEAESARPKTLALHRVRNGETPETIADRMPSEKYRRERFLILNGWFPEDPLPVGLTVKTIRE